MKPIITYLLTVFLSVFILFSAAELTASVKYKKLDLKLAATKQNDPKSLEIDLNNDNQADFVFNHGLQGSDYVCEIFSARFGYGCEIIVDNVNVPLILNSGNTISGDITGWYDTYNGYNGHSALDCRSNWNGKNDNYIAVRFKYNNTFYYGWFKVFIPDDRKYFEIKEAAYESIAGQGIKAGDKGIESVNEDLLKNCKIYTFGKNLKIELNEIHEGVIIRVYDIIGNLLNTSEIYAGETEISLNQFNPGFYFVNIQNEGIYLNKAVLIYE